MPLEPGVDSRTQGKVVPVRISAITVAAAIAALVLTVAPVPAPAQPPPLPPGLPDDLDDLLPKVDTERFKMTIAGPKGRA